MKREEEIINKGIEYGQSTPSEYDDGRYDLSDLEWAFEEGAKWADNNPSQQALSKELHRLGYGITLNGDIISKAEENKEMERYVEYQKSKLIENACEYIAEWFYNHPHTNMVCSDEFENVDDLLEKFKKAMKE